MALARQTLTIDLPQISSGRKQGVVMYRGFSVARARGEHLENIVESNRMGGIRTVYTYLRSVQEGKGPGGIGRALLRVFVRQPTRRCRPNLQRIERE